jgi:hypothetical protein
MYVLVDPKPIPNTGDFRASIRATLASMKEANPSLYINRDSSVVSSTRDTALVFRFQRETTGLREAWACLDADSVIIRIGYISREESGFQRFYTTFRETIAGYAWLGSKLPPGSKSTKVPANSTRERIK